MGACGVIVLIGDTVAIVGDCVGQADDRARAGTADGGLGGSLWIGVFTNKTVVMGHTVLHVTGAPL